MRLTYGTYVTDPAVLDAEVDVAEAAGFGTVVFSEHHGMRGYVPDPLAAATYVLGRRPGLRAGPMPILLPLHDPIAVAEAAALADALSGGRLVFGAAAGYLASEFEQRGVPLEHRGALLESGIRLVKEVWQGRAEGLDPLAQPPAQPGGPPVLVASGTPAGLRRAARVADGIVLDSVRSPAGVVALAERFRAERSALGLDRGWVAVMRRGWIGSASEVDTFVDTLFGELVGMTSAIAGSSMPWLDEPDSVTADAVRARSLVGDDAGVAAQLAELEAQGVDEVIVKLQWTSGADPAVLHDQLARWGAVCAAVMV